MAWIDRLKNGLQRTRSGLSGSIREAFGSSGAIDEQGLERIEEILVAADVGGPLAMQLVDELSETISVRRASEADVLSALRTGMAARLSGCQRDLNLRSDGQPTVILVAGVNGSGKTTTIAKITSRLRAQDPGIPVTMAAADTFRAAAIEQLQAWASHVDAELVQHRPGADPSAVVFDAVDHARATGGVLLIDTAGRLQTKHNLMQELSKIERTVTKQLKRPSDERLLVLDATTGQNGISQAKQFHRAVDLTGIVLTKVDSTAKGGVILAIWQELRLPVMYIGVGEQEQDLHEFTPDDFIEALFDNEYTSNSEVQ